MTLYTIMPAINVDDPEQCSPDLEKIKAMAAAFVTKYAADCKEVVVVEVKVVGRMQYVSPIFIDEASKKFVEDMDPSRLR